MCLFFGHYYHSPSGLKIEWILHGVKIQLNYPKILGVGTRSLTAYVEEG